MYPRNMVCFRYIIVNTLQKGDNKDDDDDDDNNNNNNNNGNLKFSAWHQELEMNIINLTESVTVNHMIVR